ncbi:MAG: PEP-utilizing enzyme, partial [Polyangiaceae bacterium]
MSTDISWERPGPGTWEFDASHQSEPFGRYTDTLMWAATERGAADGFREAGLPLETLRCAVINGWWYIKLKPLGGPEEGGGSAPPAFVFWLLFNLHPELRRRRKAARRFMSERRWEETARSWFASRRVPFVERIARLQRANPSELDDEALCEHLDNTRTLFEDLVEVHFRAVPGCAIPIGDYLVHSEAWGNISAGHAMRALAGFTEATTEPLVALDRIVSALRSEGRIAWLGEADAASILARLRDGDTQSAKLLREYEREFGVRIATGYSVLCPTLNELPQMMLGNLRRRAELDGASNPARALAERAAADLETRIPAEHRGAWRELLASARRAGALRDDDGGLSMAVLGIARGLVLEAGRRLENAGRASEAESGCDLTTEELIAALRGGGPSKQTIDGHTADRRRWAGLTPPSHLGPAPEPPPIASFPADVRRVVAAMFAFASRFSADADPIPEQGELCGHGVSPGVVRGRACLVVSSADFERFRPGDILVARATTPTYNTLLANASAIVTQTGGLISHAAIVAREFGIPGVVGVQDALEALQDGAFIEVDGDQGRIVVLGDAPPHALVAGAPAQEAPEVVVPDPEPGAEPQVVPLELAEEAASWGGKAAHSARLMRAGILVPRGVALDYTAAWLVARGDYACLVANSLRSLSAPFAVRSSANVEDSAGASFAGQFLTRLGVSRDESLPTAVREVFESAHSSGVRAYRQRLGLEAPVRMS